MELVFQGEQGRVVEYVREGVLRAHAAMLLPGSDMVRARGAS
ncbi:hypothetical protein BQ8420_00325 [Nocardiopsis sp. JB363]|nr:hypothetical protein BQ8420_00325 [Nocardiopsis sp. JB363]